MKIAISTSTFGQKDKTARELLINAGAEIIENPYGRKLTESEIIRHLDSVDGLIAGLEPLNQKVISSTNQLKAIARVGIGMDNVDVEFAKNNGIIVSNTPEEPSFAVAELTLTAALCIKRNIIPFNNELHNGIWTKQVSGSLKKSNILIIGYGRIGQKVAEFYRTLEADINIYDPYIELENSIDLCEGIKNADIISLHASGKDEILSESEFKMMKKGVVILNAARAQLINENSLTNHLENGKVGGVWLDVFWDEPYSGELTRFSNVLLTPHISTYTFQCRKSMETQAVMNIIRDLNL